MNATEPNENRKQSLKKEQRREVCAALHKENVLFSEKTPRKEITYV